MSPDEGKSGMEQVLIGFGSNQGDSVLICSQAVEMLDRHSRIRIRRVSSFYRTEPVGMKDQDWFINGVVLCETDLEPEGLLSVTRQIEAHFHRVRHHRWGPRTLDLDILFFGERCIDLPDLIVPHPRLHERRFVLVPLAELAPQWVHPVLGISVRELLARLPITDQKVEPLAVSERHN